MVHKTFSVLLGTILIFGLVTITQPSTIDDDTYKLIPNIDHKQLICLTNNVYHEAGSESFEGKLAVAQVTLNRVESGRFGSSICGTVYQKIKSTCQFSWVCQGKKEIAHKASKQYAAAKEAAYRVLVEGYRIKKLHKALYFHASYVEPGWNRKVVARIGNHIFYS